MQSTFPSNLLFFLFLLVACNEVNHQTSSATKETPSLPEINVQDLDDQQQIYRVRKGEFIFEDYYVLNDIIVIVSKNTKDNETKLIKQILVDDFLENFKSQFQNEKSSVEDVSQARAILFKAQRFKDVAETCVNAANLLQGHEDEIEYCALDLFWSGDGCNSLRFFNMMKDQDRAQVIAKGHKKVMGDDYINKHCPELK